jgi:hypothetical protein
MKKKLIAFMLFLSMLCLTFTAAYIEAIDDFSDVATPTDLQPVYYDYTINRSNMPQYSIIAFDNASITGHIRGSIYVGGTLTGSQYVDDGALNNSAPSYSYVHKNESSINFRSRTPEQSPDAYYLLSSSSAESTASYWKNFIENLPNDETYIYLEPDENGVVNISPYDYQANGSDEAYRTINKVYWTDARVVNMAGLAGHLIAPYATVNISNCNHCGSIVAQNIYTSGEDHINTFVPPTPSEPTPTPTPEPVDLTIDKTLIGSVWHIRCDYMDGITFKAGGGIWRRDWIKNPSGLTSKEGHRSNKCGDADHWVIWVDTNGNPFRMDEIKSGSTGGTLPTIIYEPRYQMSHDEILAMESGDPDLIWKYSQNFIDVKDWSTIQLGVRMYWTTSNGNQVWYHTGIPYKVNSPTYTIYIDGQGYNLVANEGSVTIEDLEAGVHTIVEENYPDTYISNIYVNGVALSEYDGSIEITADTRITVENTLITPPPTSSPTPPPTPVVPTPTPTTTPEESPTPTPTTTPEESPTPTPTTTPEESPTPTPTTTPEESPTPTPSESPTPTPTTTPEESPTPTPTTTPEETPEPVGFTIRKIVNGELSENAIFFFKITGPEDYEEYYEVIVEAETGKGEIFIDNVRAGKYTVEEVDIPEGFALVSEESITKYIVGINMEFEFVNELEPTPTPTPTPTLEPTPTPTPTPATPTDLTPPPTTPPTTVTPSEVPITPTPPPPTPTPTPEYITTPIPSEVVSPTPTPTPTPEPTEEPEPEPIMKELTLIKIWSDNDNESQRRPNYIMADLYANGQLIQVITSYTETFVIEVPVYDEEEKEIEYTWREHEVLGYRLQSMTTSGDTTVLVNSLIDIPKVPENVAQPRVPTRTMHTVEFEEYTVALGVNVMINHVGDCFD